MRLYRDLDFVEQLGSGIYRILSAYADSVFKLSDHFLEVCFLFDEGYFTSQQTEAQVAAQVEPLPWQTKILKGCSSDEKTGQELLSIAGFTSRSGNFKKGFQHLVDENLIEMTLPDKPNSRNQKYPLTRKGQRLLKEEE